MREWPFWGLGSENGIQQKVNTPIFHIIPVVLAKNILEWTSSVYCFNKLSVTGHCMSRKSVLFYKKINKKKVCQDSGMICIYTVYIYMDTHTHYLSNVWNKAFFVLTKAAFKLRGGAAFI